MGDYTSYEGINGLDRASLLLNVLGREATSKIFGHMKDNDIKRMIAAMAEIEKAPISAVKKILEDFFYELSEEDSLIFGRSRGKDFILQTLGEDRATQILGNISIQDSSRTLEALELVDTRTLSNFLINEHPQTIALILAHLDPMRKSDTLKRLPEPIQAEVVMRMANIDYISPELISSLDEVLKAELASVGNLDNQQLGGVEPVAEMLNSMDKSTETSILARIEEKDPQLAEEIKRLMFVFDDLIAVDDRGMQTLLKEVPNDKLILALKVSSPEVSEKMFKNMSTRAAQLLKEDLENMGPQRLSDVEAAQSEIVNIAKRLESEGKIQINRGGGGDEFV